MQREREREGTNTKLSLIWREKIQHYRYLGEKKIQSFRPDVATKIQNIQQLQKTDFFSHIFTLLSWGEMFTMYKHFLKTPLTQLDYL
jgi:hypothetical protein